jgi:hypothetical protein
MRKILLVMCCCLGALLLFACAKPESSTNKEAPPTNSSASSSPAPTKSATTTASTGEKIGVAECDDFITAYENCVTGKVPEAARVQYQAGIATWRTQWKKLAENPQTKPTLVTMCKTQLETSRTAMKSFGCTF